VDPDPSFHVNAIRILILLLNKISDPPGLHFNPPRLHVSVHGSILSLWQKFDFNVNPDPNPAFYPDGIRIYLPKLMRIRICNPAQNIRVPISVKAKSKTIINPPLMLH
jgi:hypothetical protein